MEKPPLGLRPRFIVDELRMQEIEAAMRRYLEAGYQVPPDWMTEYVELYNRNKK